MLFLTKIYSLKVKNHGESRKGNWVIAHTDPNVVPRMVWGLRNLQKASLNWETLFNSGSLPAASTLEQA